MPPQPIEPTNSDLLALPGPVKPQAIDVVVDDHYVEDCMMRASDTQLSHFNLMLLPAEIRIMIIDELVLSTVSAAASNHQAVKKRALSWESHEAWLVALETLKNVVACDLDFAAQVFDSTNRLHPPASASALASERSLSEDNKAQGEQGEANKTNTRSRDHGRDDCLSELLYSARFQLCRTHGQALLDCAPSTLKVFQRRPTLERDLWRLSPGPEDVPIAQEAWNLLYGKEVEKPGSLS